MIKSSSLLVIAAMAGGFLISTGASAGDVLRGQEKSLSCQACHGTDGNSPIPTFPILAGQHRDYLLQSMRDYKSGVRANAVMKVIVDPLSDLDMQDLAAYYASQKGLRKIDAGRLKEIP